MTDPISDMLTRIRNAMAVRKPEVVLPFSKMKLSIAQILKDNGYLANVEKLEKGQAGNSFTAIRLTLKYLGGKESAISNIKRISKPGLRVYTGKGELPKILNNLGIAIISTSQGLMTNKEARKKNLGGEVICEVY
jgi:small subunit ribosomal protein S8